MYLYTHMYIYTRIDKRSSRNILIKMLIVFSLNNIYIHIYYLKSYVMKNISD